MGLSPLRILIVAVVALIVLGPDKLPQVARQAGTLWHNLRSLQQRVEDEIREVAPDLPRSADLVKYARSPVALLNQLADKAKADAALSADGEEAAASVEPEVTGPLEYTPPDDGPEVTEAGAPLVYGDPSLN